MNLIPLRGRDLIEQVAGWLEREENYRWLDFGNGQQIVTPAVLNVMAQRPTHVLRVYTADDGRTPIGVVGLENLNRTFGTATLWGATGDKSFRSRGYAAHAGSQFLSMVYSDYDLHAINTWVVDGNPSRRLVERLGFRYCGRQRAAHCMDGKRYDRLLFDLLASEFRERDVQPPHRRRQESAPRNTS